MTTAELTMALPHAESESAVSIRELRKCFGPVTAVDNVTLTVKRGEFFSLLGPSGCGKTSLLRMIGGFEEFDSGQILIDGHDMTGVPPYSRSTNMIFQNLALFPHMTVFENIAFGLRRKKISRSEIVSRVGEVLHLVRLDGFEQRMPHQLSGGQRQRVAMARALVNRPSVLLLDEPLGALDLQLRINMQEELRRLHRILDSTFIFVTHDQGEAMSMSDRIAVMNSGRILQAGTPEEIYEKPSNRFVAAFIGHTNLLEARVIGFHSRERIAVECHGITIICRGTTGLSKGQKVTVAVRYERVGVTRSNNEESSFSGCVTDRTYLGNAVRVVSRVNDQLTLTADIADTTHARDVVVGQTVKLSFAAESAVAVPD